MNPRPTLNAIVRHDIICKGRVSLPESIDRKGENRRQNASPTEERVVGIAYPHGASRENLFSRTFLFAAIAKPEKA